VSSQACFHYDNRVKYLREKGLNRQGTSRFSVRPDYIRVLRFRPQAGSLTMARDSLWLQWRAIMGILRVSARSRSTAVAGAIAGVVRENGRAEAQAIGAGAVNQAVKAVAIARGYLALDGLDVICIPAFTDVQIEGKERTAMKLIVEPR
jgi:stage V sporulation protein S